jgi:hypothetical protein
MQQFDLFHQRWSMFHAAVWRQADWFRRHYCGSQHPGIKGYLGFWDEYRIKRGAPSMTGNSVRSQQDPAESAGGRKP